MISEMTLVVRTFTHMFSWQFILLQIFHFIPNTILAMYVVFKMENNDDNSTVWDSGVASFFSYIE